MRRVGEEEVVRRRVVRVTEVLLEGRRGAYPTHDRRATRLKPLMEHTGYVRR